MTLIEVFVVILGVTGWLLLLLVALTALMLIGSIAYAVIKKDAVYGSIGVVVVVVAVLCMILGFDWEIMHILTGLFHFTLDYGWIVLLLMLVGAFVVQHKHRSKTTKLIVVLLIVALVLRVFAGYVQYEKAEPQRTLAERVERDAQNMAERAAAEKQREQHEAAERRKLLVKWPEYQMRFNHLCKQAGSAIYQQVPRQHSLANLSEINQGQDLYQYDTIDRHAFLGPEIQCKVNEFDRPAGFFRRSVYTMTSYFQRVEFIKQPWPRDQGKNSYWQDTVVPYESIGYDIKDGEDCAETEKVRQDRIRSMRVQTTELTRMSSEYGYRVEVAPGVDPEINLHGTRLQIVHVPTGTVVAERLRYRLTPDRLLKHLPVQYCPSINSDEKQTVSDEQFIMHVLYRRQSEVEEALATNESP